LTNKLPITEYLIMLARKISVAIAALALIAASIGCESTVKEPEGTVKTDKSKDQSGTPAQPAKSPETTGSPANDPPNTMHPALLAPRKANEKAPAKFDVKFNTTKGDFTITVTRDWSPLAADRFYNLVRIGYYNDIAFFRVIPGFMAQFGIHGDVSVNKAWREATIEDEPVTQSNLRGYVTFAMGGPNSRTVQTFISTVDNSRLDGQKFAPFGQVTSGMEVVDKLYNGYGEGQPRGQGPEQNRIQFQNNAYLKTNFPRLDYIKSASIVE